MKQMRYDWYRNLIPGSLCSWNLLAYHPRSLRQLKVLVFFNSGCFVTYSTNPIFFQLEEFFLINPFLIFKDESLLLNLLMGPFTDELVSAWLIFDTFNPSFFGLRRVILMLNRFFGASVVDIFPLLLYLVWVSLLFLIYHNEVSTLMLTFEL